MGAWVSRAGPGVAGTGSGLGAPGRVACDRRFRPRRRPRAVLVNNFCFPFLRVCPLVRPGLRRCREAKDKTIKVSGVGGRTGRSEDRGERPGSAPRGEHSIWAVGPGTGQVGAGTAAGGERSRKVSGEGEARREGRGAGSPSPPGVRGRRGRSAWALGLAPLHFSPCLPRPWSSPCPGPGQTPEFTARASSDTFNQCVCDSGGTK